MIRFPLHPFPYLKPADGAETKAARLNLMSVSQKTAFRFETFRFKRRGGLTRLRASGVWEPVTLGSRALDVLMTLVGRPGELLTKQELMDAVWPDVAVEDSNLTVQISALRRVLDEGRAEGSCIQTVIGRGYRFLAPVIVELDAPVAMDAVVPARRIG